LAESQYDSLDDQYGEIHMRISQSCMHLVEYADPWRFEERVGEWMRQRDVESTDLIEILLILRTGEKETRHTKARMFAVMDREQPAAAAILLHDGHLVTTRASGEALHALADGLFRADCTLSSVYGLARTARDFAQLWAARTGQHYELDPCENRGHQQSGVNNIIFWPLCRTGLV
jgi:hypothetical protein